MFLSDNYFSINHFPHDALHHCNIMLSNEADAIIVLNIMHVRLVKVQEENSRTNYKHVFSFPLFFHHTCNSRSAPPASPIQSRKGRRIGSARGTGTRRCAVMGRCMCVKSRVGESASSKTKRVQLGE